MKKIIITVIVLVFVLVLAFGIIFFPELKQLYFEKYSSDYSQSGNSISASDFTVYDTNGKEKKLSDFVGKPIVVNFWATWCGYCVKELPDFEKIYQQYGNDVSFLMVDLADGSRETKKDAEKFIKTYSYTFPVYFDLDFSASEAYSIRSIPMTLILDKEGNLVETHYGTMDGSDLKFYLDSMLEEKQTEE